MGAEGLGSKDLPAVDGLRWVEQPVKSTLDGTMQPNLIGVPEAYNGQAPLPLLIGLHTWAGQYRQMAEPYGREAAQRRWLLLLPHFRGPNIPGNPDPLKAGGSLYAQRDVLDAFQYVKANYRVDETRVYLLGGSGGGYMALLMASKYPEYWAGVSSWCPVTNLRAWYREGLPDRQKQLEAVCGGKPGDSAEVDWQYLVRSVSTFLTNAAWVPLSLHHGDHDPVIQPQQSKDTWAVLAALPRHRATFEIFDGGHTAKTHEGCDWLARQRHPQEVPRELWLVTDEAKWYYWAHLTPAGPRQLAKCHLKLEGENLLVEAQGLDQLALDLQSLGGEDLPTLTVRAGLREDTPEFVLHLTISGIRAPHGDGPWRWQPEERILAASVRGGKSQEWKLEF